MFLIDPPARLKLRYYGYERRQSSNLSHRKVCSVIRSIQLPFSDPFPSHKLSMTLTIELSAFVEDQSQLEYNDK